MMTNDSTNSRNENRFKAYYNDHQCFEHWTVRDNQTNIMYPMNSQNLAEDIAEMLNDLNNENRHIKQTLANMIATERTHIGKNILIQLQEAIQ